MYLKTRHLNSWHTYIYKDLVDLYILYRIYIIYHWIMQ